MTFTWYLARTELGTLLLFTRPPRRYKSPFLKGRESWADTESTASSLVLDSGLFPEVTYSNSPVPVRASLTDLQAALIDNLTLELT